MATDQASADYEQEQANRVALSDNKAFWAEEEVPPSSSEPFIKQCVQCVNWHPARSLHLADGTTQESPGFCTLRAAADLAQLPQSYAEECRFYEEDIPF